MRHEDVQNYLSDYIEGLLDPALAAATENHLRQCDGCRREETSLRAVFHALEDPTLNIAPPPMFHADAMRKVRLAAQSGADRRGFWERLGWPKVAAGSVAAAALLTALVLNVGPLTDGIHAGYTPEIRTTAPHMPTAEIIGGDVRAGGAVVLRTSEEAQLLIRTSGGLSHYARSGATVTFSVAPDAAGTVQEVALAVNGVGRAVFIPVETGGSAQSTEDWRPRSTETLRTALQGAARAYGAPITAPEAALTAPVNISLQSANAATAIPAIAHAAGLTATNRNGTWQLG